MMSKPAELLASMEKELLASVEMGLLASMKATRCGKPSPAACSRVGTVASESWQTHLGLRAKSKEPLASMEIELLASNTTSCSERKGLLASMERWPLASMERWPLAATEHAASKAANRSKSPGLLTSMGRWPGLLASMEAELLVSMESPAFSRNRATSSGPGSRGTARGRADAGATRVGQAARRAGRR